METWSREKRLTGNAAGAKVSTNGLVSVSCFLEEKSTCRRQLSWEKSTCKRWLQWHSLLNKFSLTAPCITCYYHPSIMHASIHTGVPARIACCERGSWRHCDVIFAQALRLPFTNNIFFYATAYLGVIYSKLWREMCWAIYRIHSLTITTGEHWLMMAIILGKRRHQWNRWAKQ